MYELSGTHIVALSVINTYTYSFMLPAHEIKKKYSNFSQEFDKF